MRRWLVTGGSGLLGSNLSLQLRESHELVVGYSSHPVDIPGCRCVRMDITEPTNLRRLAEETRPDAVVHCAAMTNVDQCEGDPEGAHRLNVVGTREVAEAAEAVGARMIYISTDSVFSGTRGWYTESDRPGPPSVYAQTKLLGEHEVKRTCRHWLIVRTTIYGWTPLGRKGFVEWIVSGLSEGRELPLFEDVHFTPILVTNLARAIADADALGLGGILNVCGSERGTKLEFARLLAQQMALDESLIRPTPIAQVALAAQRPLDPSLDVSRAQSLLSEPLLDLAGGLQELAAQVRNGHRDALRSALVTGG